MAPFISQAFPASVAFTFALMILCMVSVMADLRRLEHPIKADGSLSFLVVGDWGRKGKYNQSEVAHQMGRVGERLKVDFIISTGDNFYEHGLMGVDDPKFEESFTNIYTAESLQKQWYSVLGNHDYRGNVEAQLSPVLSKLDSKWLCMRSFILNAEIVEFVFVDTTPFVDKYFTDPEGQTYDWSGVFPRQKYLSNLLKNVDLALRESTAKWKIVVGHHTMKSAGVHGNTEELNRLLLPVLEENNVDLYINGHDHCMEHIKTDDSSVEFITSGGGSKAWRGIVRWTKPEELKFYYDGQGFMSAEMNEKNIDVVFYDVFGEAMYKWSASKSHAAF